MQAVQEMHPYEYQCTCMCLFLQAFHVTSGNMALLVHVVRSENNIKSHSRIFEITDINVHW